MTAATFYSHMPYLVVIQHPECLELVEGYLCVCLKQVTHSEYRPAILKQSATKEEIAAAGEKTMIQNYNGKEADSLNDLRLKRFYSKVTDGKTAIHPRKLLCLIASECTNRFKDGWELATTRGKELEDQRPRPHSCSH